MTADDDGAARFAYLAEGNARQARKRVAADVLLRDEQGRVLLVNPTYKPHWDLPGGMAEANESPRAAAERELREELGLTLVVGRLLALDWQPAHGPWDDLLIFTFDGGTLTEESAGSIRFFDQEIGEFALVPIADAPALLRADVAERLLRSVAAINNKTTNYTESWRDHTGPELVHHEFTPDHLIGHCSIPFGRP